MIKVGAGGEGLMSENLIIGLVPKQPVNDFKILNEAHG